MNKIDREWEKIEKEFWHKCISKIKEDGFARSEDMLDWFKIKLNQAISSARLQERKEMGDYFERKYAYTIETLQKQNELLLEQLQMKHLSEPMVFEVKGLDQLLPQIKDKSK